MLSHNELRAGSRVEIDGYPWIIINAQFVKPGKGQAFTKIKIKNLVDGRLIVRTFKSSEKVAKADVIDQAMQYLYSDGDFYHFMDPVTFDQFSLSETQVGRASQWLKIEENYQVTLWKGEAISVVPPPFVNLTITHCEPGIKGDTVSGATKPATLETGATVKVPLFIKEGELIRVDTRTGDYVERAKK